ncbi:rNA polymerase sigma-43 factor [Prevotella sp. CAG:924]|nr:rNA polymerase sigma-43 factor [Prevotella sp. CAG:924]
MDKDKNSLSAYLNEIGKEKHLTAEEERELAERIHKGDSRAIDKLTQANLTFVVSMARQYKDRGLAMEDLVSEGNIGMLQAATRFDGREGKRFVTFAAPYIREAIEKAIDQQSLLYRVPKDVMDAARARQIGRPLSIDAPVGGSAELSLGRVIPDKNASHPDENLYDGLLKDELVKLLDQLDSREREVVQRFYGLGVASLTMAEIGKELGLKRERVRQIRDKAVRHICRLTHNSGLKTYLQR